MHNVAGALEKDIQCAECATDALVTVVLASMQENVMIIGVLNMYLSPSPRSEILTERTGDRF